ncbi:MAG TPA: type I secretion system permease/ATPase [Ideonella sp.]|nr:type I secretion system permease/ATPase [Ideonella sp.]
MPPATDGRPRHEGLRHLLRRQLAWALLFSLAINLALLAPSLFMLQVYDRVLVTRSLETLTMLVAFALITLVAFAALDQVRSRLLTVLGMVLEQRLGPVVLPEMMLRQARPAPDAAPVDGMRDLGTLRMFLSGPGIVALFDAPWAVVYLALIAAFDWHLGLLATGATLLLLLLTWANQRLVRGSFARIQADARGAARWIERGMQNAEAVTALGMAGALVRRWATQTDAVQRATLASSAGSSALSAVSRGARQAIQVVMLAAGAWLVIREGVTPGVMIASTIILGRALAPVEQLLVGWGGLVEARAAHDRLRQLLEQCARRQSGTALPRPTGRVAVEALSYVAPGSQRALLRHVSLQLQAGEIMAIVGGSGAGKTTLARLLVGVLKPTAGAVRLDGAEIAQYEPEQLGAALGYLPQDVELFAGTVAENIARFSIASASPGAEVSAAVLAAAEAAGAHELILRLPGGYDTPVGESGRQLSGGQRQRVALARALFGAPALVVLDEPDASLDAEGEEALMAALQRIKARGASVIAVTQRRRLLGLADKVVVMRDGAVERMATRNDPNAELGSEAGKLASMSLEPGDSARKES